jgi:hypothetical protein
LTKTMFHFTIRDMLWLTVVVALCLGWLLDRRLNGTQLRWQSRAEHLASVCRDQGWTVKWHADYALLAYPPHPDALKPKP